MTPAITPLPTTYVDQRWKLEGQITGLRAVAEKSKRAARAKAHKVQDLTEEIENLEQTADNAETLALELQDMIFELDDAEREGV